LSDSERRRVGEMLRFCAVGTAAMAVHYGVYYALLGAMPPNGAFAIGFAVSFVCNFALTTMFTFRVGFAARRFLGFAASHCVNFVVQAALLNLFLAAGVPKAWALLPVYAVSVPVCFLLVRRSMLGNRGKQ